jgi:hypothetical protein
VIDFRRLLSYGTPCSRKTFVSNASRVILILCVILIASGGTLTANSGKSAELAGLLANARTLENLRSEPAAPFLLRASFTASLS